LNKMKTAIAGAGICGLYLAWKLSEKGNNVEVFEKKEKIGKEVCSGLFSKKILKFIPQAEKLVENRINYALIHFPKKTLKIIFSEKFLVMSHARLDRAVAVLAKKAGAKIALGKNVNKVPKGFDRIIGCDGPMSVIRSILKIKEPNFRIAMQGFIKKADSSDFVETWPIKNGFLWKIPRGKEIEYGIIGDSFDYCRMILEDFLKKENIKLNRLKSALVPKEYFRFLIPQNEQITICGDAAALVKPWSGGGVVWGLSAADILVREFPDFLRYRASVKKIFYYKILFSSILTKIVYFLGFNVPWIFPKEIKLEGDFLRHAR
jgi:digeranylgeranylglycerophospholipid reductase